MRIQPQPAPRGIALIIVMIVIITLGVSAGLFAYAMKVETTLARNSNLDSELEWMARSGFELAKYVLSQSGPGGMQVDALNQKWAGGTGDTNSPVANIPLDNYEFSPGRSISVKIIDLDRKFNINTITVANSEILRQAMILIGTDAAETPHVVNAILDWMDPDDSPQMGTSDTESAYYRTLTPPYRAKNGPIDDLTELMLVHYISPAMYYGSGQVAELARTRRHGLHGTPQDEPTYPVGFVDLFTTLSSGQVNINTASATVLQLMPDVDESVAQAIITARAGPDGSEGNEDDMPFRSTQELQRVPGLLPQTINQFARYFTVRSTTFEVQVDAQIGGYKRHFVSILRRDGNRFSQLYMYWH
jgi:type II secretory pathway component PulK